MRSLVRIQSPRLIKLRLARRTIRGFAAPRKSEAQNRHTRPDEATALLIQNQAAMVQNQTALLRRLAEIERVTAEPFSRIETDIAAILRVLSEHSRLLDRLPEAVREKIGFKSQPRATRFMGSNPWRDPAHLSQIANSGGVASMVVSSPLLSAIQDRPS